jgi:hypothetical protein
MRNGLIFGRFTDLDYATAAAASKPLCEKQRAIRSRLPRERNSYLGFYEGCGFQDDAFLSRIGGRQSY